jgi:astacin
MIAADQLFVAVRVLLASLTLVQATGGSVNDDVTWNSCVPECARDAVTQYKEKCAHELGVRLNNISSMSPYPGGNQCWDCGTGQKVLISLGKSARRRRQAYNFTAFPSRQWSLPVQFAFNSTLPSSADLGGVDARAVIRQAIGHIEAQTCIGFVEISPDTTTTTSYMSFGNGTGCVAFVGRTLDTISSPIFATNDCLQQFGEMLYLIVQNLGVWHESQRPDRDIYVGIVPDNVSPGYGADLGKLDPSLQLLETFGLPYDYASLMHFPGKIFSINGSDTIQTVDPLYQRTIGQRVQLSFLDTKLLNLMYCQGACAGKPLTSPCQNGGYQDPNNCAQCHCPDGFGGTDCTALAPAQRAAVCGGTLTALPTEQTITSPGYTSPGYYDDTQFKCTWRIQGPVGSQIRLRFVGDFGLYCKNGACYHWLEVRYRGSMNVTGPRSCCNAAVANELVTDANEAVVIFQSNISGIAQTNRRGFQLAYSIVPAVTSPPPAGGPGGPCSSNPCLNNGVCNETTSSPTGYICVCPAGLMGQFCEQGFCGGCSAQPGQPQQLCVAEEVPVRMCNVTRRGIGSSSSSRRGGGRYRRGGGFLDLWGFFPGGRRHAPRTDVVQVPCTFKFCCNNAVMVGIPDFNQACAVEGWTDWTSCPTNCGGGLQVKTQYAVQSTTVGAQTFNLSVIVNTTTAVCNTQPCNCTTRGSRWSYGSWWGSRWCSPCSFGFQQFNSTLCVRAA